MIFLVRVNVQENTQKKRGKLFFMSTSRFSGYKLSAVFSMHPTHMLGAGSQNTMSCSF